MLHRQGIAKKEPRKVIYYHCDGCDNTGDGSARFPFRTYEGAVKSMPLLLDAPCPRIRNLEFA